MLSLVGRYLSWLLTDWKLEYNNPSVSRVGAREDGCHDFTRPPHTQILGAQIPCVRWHSVCMQVMHILQ